MFRQATVSISTKAGLAKLVELVKKYAAPNMSEILRHKCDIE